MLRFLIRQLQFWTIVCLGYLAFAALGIMAGFSGASILQELGLIRQWAGHVPYSISVAICACSVFLILFLFWLLWRLRRPMAFFWLMLFSPCAVAAIFYRGWRQGLCYLVIFRAGRQLLIRRAWLPIIGAAGKQRRLSRV